MSFSFFAPLISLSMNDLEINNKDFEGPVCDR